MYKRRHINKCYKYANVHLANWQMRKSKLIFYGVSGRARIALSLCVYTFVRVCSMSLTFCSIKAKQQKGNKQRIQQ